MAKGKDNELRIVRVYDAPVKLVWECFTNEKHQAKWWGPRGFTITTKSKDLRPGGTWDYIMHGPDGVDWPNFTTYHVVEKYSKLVYDHGASSADAKPLFRVTVTFEEFKGKTVMDMSMALETPEAAKEIGKFIKQARGNATWDRLAEYLEQEQHGKDPFVINHSFDAPIATVFEMFTNPKHFSKWLPPAGFNMEYYQGEIKTGGTTFYKISSPEMTHFGKMSYQEITPVTRIVYTQCFTDEKGNLTKPPFEKNWPNYMLTTVTLAEEGPNETRVTVSWEILNEASAVERKTFHDAKPGMTEGWEGSFDKLEDLLIK